MDSWTRLERWFAAHLPEVVEDLRPPATEDELRAVERVIGATLPADVRELYRIHDGQSDDATGVFFGLPLLPLAGVVRAWTTWRDVIDPATNEEISEGCTSEPASAIQCLYTCRGWIPLSDDYGGNHLGVDLAPGPLGARGQVIHFGRDENDKHVLAASFDDFLLKLGDLLESGNFVIDDGALSLGRPPVQHLLDAAAFVARLEVRRVH